MNTSEANPAVHGAGDKCVQGAVVQVPVQVCMLQTLLSALPDSLRVQILKVDTQGNDLKVLKGFSESLYQNIDYIMIETPDINEAEVVGPKESLGGMAVVC